MISLSPRTLSSNMGSYNTFTLIIIYDIDSYNLSYAALGVTKIYSKAKRNGNFDTLKKQVLASDLFIA